MTPKATKVVVLRHGSRHDTQRKAIVFIGTERNVVDRMLSVLPTDRQQRAGGQLTFLNCRSHG